MVSVVTVNYNNVSVTCELIESLKKISYPNIEIIVVDNASSEPPDLIADKYPFVKLIRNSVNKGFAGGNNDGLSVAKGKYILMLNNDTEVPERFLEPLVTAMENDPAIGACSPKICYYHTPGIIQFAGGDGINVYTGRGKFTGNRNADGEKFNCSREIVHTHGAAMLLSRKAVEDIGLLYEDYFLYYEELDYCERLRKAGYKIWYVGASVVYHKESSSVGKENPMKVYYLTRNRLIFMKRNVQGYAYLLSMMFFVFASVPNNTLRYLRKKRPDLLKAFYKGVGDYVAGNKG